MALPISLADIAIFPFIQQFSAVDPAWFQAAPYPKVSAWLNKLVASNLFIGIMQKQPT
ncbi:MAG: glutathione S-transferase C-terminal domain-containing protein [Betaproteobacteria bacterium]